MNTISMSYHLRGNFYPPLPINYAEPDIKAGELYQEENYGAVVLLPADIVPHPATAVKTDAGWEITASELVRILRLDR